MAARSRDRARTLELVIRAAVAEEHLLSRRLARSEEEHRRTRAQIERELRRERWGRPPSDGNGVSEL
jgi:hypothetical protein